MDLQKLSSNFDYYSKAQENNGWSYSANRGQSAQAKANIDGLNKIINQDTYDTYVPSSKKNEQESMTKLVKKMLAEYAGNYIKQKKEEDIISFDELCKECFGKKLEEKGIQGVTEDILTANNVQQEELDKKGLIGVLQDINNNQINTNDDESDPKDLI